MIKLTRAPAPAYLTPGKVMELTEAFKQSGKDVWNNDKIKIPLRGSSHNKCAYCECSVTEESKYMEVEHFESKENNPDKVVDWENLLPSCKRCNGNKDTHDVIKDPIINPYLEQPNLHFSLKNYRLKDKTDKGKMSIDVLGLNDYDRVIKKRFDIGNKISESVDIASERFDTYLAAKTVRSKNKLIGLVEGILLECQANAIYTATTATIACTDDNFTKLISKMKNEKIWLDRLEQLWSKSTDFALP